MKVEVSIYCKKGDKNKKGLAPIYHKIIFKSPGKRALERLIPTKKKINPDYFDNESEKAFGPNGFKMNTILNRDKAKLQQILIDLEAQKKKITFELIQKKFSDQSTDGFIDYAESKLSKIKSNIAYKTWESYRDSIKVLKEYSTDVCFNDITPEFLGQFEGWMKNNKRGSKNGRYQVFAMIRKFLNLAIQDGYTVNYPFKEFKFRPGKTIKDFLLEQERDKLFILFTEGEKLNERQKRTLGNFLFTCNTGIAGDDMRNKSRLKFIDNHVVFFRGKTDEPIRIPLTTQAKALVEFVKNNNLKQSISRTNEDLVEIMKIAGIDKKITYHAGRNTFAIVALMKGVNIKVIQKILGHTTVKTTEIYLQVVDEFLNDEIVKMDSHQRLDQYRLLAYEVLSEVLELTENELKEKYEEKVERFVKRKLVADQPVLKVI